MRGESFLLLSAPKRERERDDQKNNRQNAPGYLARSHFSTNFKAPGRLVGDAEGVCAGWSFASIVAISELWPRRRSLAGRFKIVGDGLLFVEADRARVGAYETFVEKAAGELAEFFIFERVEHTRSDLGGGGDLLERHFLFFAFELELFTERGQGVSSEIWLR